MIKEAKQFDGFYIEKVELIDMVQTESEAIKVVSNLQKENNDDCVYKYSSTTKTTYDFKNLTFSQLLFTKKMIESEICVRNEIKNALIIELKKKRFPEPHKE